MSLKFLPLGYRFWLHCPFTRVAIGGGSEVYFHRTVFTVDAGGPHSEPRTLWGQGSGFRGPTPKTR